MKKVKVIGYCLSIAIVLSLGFVEITQKYEVKDTSTQEGSTALNYKDTGRGAGLYPPSDIGTESFGKMEVGTYYGRTPMDLAENELILTVPDETKSEELPEKLLVKTPYGLKVELSRDETLLDSSEKEDSSEEFTWKVGSNFGGSLISGLDYYLTSVTKDSIEISILKEDSVVIAKYNVKVGVILEFGSNIVLIKDISPDGNYISFIKAEK